MVSKLQYGPYLFALGKDEQTKDIQDKCHCGVSASNFHWDWCAILKLDLLFFCLIFIVSKIFFSTTGKSRPKEVHFQSRINNCWVYCLKVNTHVLLPFASLNLSYEMASILSLWHHLDYEIIIYLSGRTLMLFLWCAIIWSIRFTLQINILHLFYF